MPRGIPLSRSLPHNCHSQYPSGAAQLGRVEVWAISTGPKVAWARRSRDGGEIPAPPRVGESAGHRPLASRSETCFGKLTQLPSGL